MQYEYIFAIGRGTYGEDKKGMHHHQEPIQELPGDDSTPAPTSPLSSRISELDSIRPVSDLESVSSSHRRWSSLHEAPAAERASKLPVVVENESRN